MLYYWWKAWKQGGTDPGLPYLRGIGEIDGHMDRFSVMTTMSCMNEVLSLKTLEVIAFPLKGVDPEGNRAFENHFVEVEDPSQRKVIIFCQRRRSDPCSTGILLVMEAGWFRVLHLPRGYRDKLRRLCVGVG